MTQISIIGRSYYIDSTNPNPKLSTNPGGYTYSPTAPRLMYTITQPNIEFEFQAPPTQFEMEGFGAEINEIKRPYSLPIADIYGGKLRRLSFEFAIIRLVKVPGIAPTLAIPARRGDDGGLISPPVPARRGQAPWSYYDGMTNSVEDQLERLQLISDTGIPVGFENMSPQIQAYAWVIDDMKWTLTRDSVTGNAVAATCTMSFIEYRAARQRFILMPRFAYGVPAAQAKAGAKNVTNPGLNARQAWLKPLFMLKVASRVSLGQITYPLTRQALQALLNSTATANNKGSFVIPEEWITELKTKYKPK